MTESCPTKSEIEFALKKLRSVQTNKICFDCNAKNPSWASATYGVFICLDCSAVHRGLGVHVSFVKSTQLDSNWTWLQLRCMQLGGNSNANTFFQQHSCTTTDAQQKYNSRAAQLYREKLTVLAQKAMKIHGTNIHIDQTRQEPSSLEEKTDFFEEHNNFKALQHSNPVPFPNQNISNGQVPGGEESGPGPNVEAALTMSPTEAQKLSAQQPRKSTIGQRKPASKLGGKKTGGLGAQRVKTDFSAIEKEATQNDLLRQQQTTATQQKSKGEQEKNLVSLQQAYETMGLASKREEERMMRVDPKKAQQAERLGMGLGVRGAVSHSMFGEMQTIEQERPVERSSLSASRSGPTMRDSDIEDDSDYIIRFSSGPPKYKDSPFDDPSFSSFSSRGSGIDDLLTATGKTNNTTSASSSSSNWENEFEKIDMPTNSNNKVSASANYKFNPVDDQQAQNKFGSAKAISSDMFFGDRDPNAQMQSQLSRFEGSSAISSADLFGETQPKRNQGPTIQAPDLDEVRESVRQGVTKVAGRLSNMATNVMSSIQRK